MLLSAWSATVVTALDDERSLVPTDGCCCSSCCFCGFSDEREAASLSPAIAAVATVWGPRRTEGEAFDDATLAQMGPPNVTRRGAGEADGVADAAAEKVAAAVRPIVATPAALRTCESMASIRDPLRARITICPARVALPIDGDASAVVTCSSSCLSNSCRFAAESVATRLWLSTASSRCAW